MAEDKTPQSSDLRIVLVGKTGSGKSSTGNTILGREAFNVDSLPESVTRECQKEEGVVAPQSSDLRIVLVGKTGAGKSATGNTILGREAFKVDSLPESVTRECQKAEGVVDGRNVMVVDTPGVYDTSLSPEEVKREMVRCIEMSVPGPHAFLLVVRLGGRYTEEERNAVEWIRENFGEEADMYTVAVFSHVDQLKEKTVEDALKSSKDLQRLVHQCGGRYIRFNNDLEDPTQVSELIRKIEDMLKSKTDSYYTNEMYEAAQRKIREEEERKREEERLRAEKERLIEEKDRLRQKKKKLAEEEKNIRPEKEIKKEGKRYKIVPGATAGAGGAAVIAGGVALGVAEAVILGPVVIAVGSVALVGGICWFRYEKRRDRKKNVDMTSEPETLPLIPKKTEE